MKIQDIFFIVLLLILIYKWKPRAFLVSAFVFVLAAIPLFYLQIFFTAQRFMYYAFFLLLFTLAAYLYVKKK